MADTITRERLEQRRVGKSDIFVSRLGLGCVTFGREVDEVESFQLLDQAVAGGITLLSRDYLTPYDNPIGQLVLLLVVGGFFGGFAWIRSVSRVELPARMLARPEDLEIGPIS